MKPHLKILAVFCAKKTLAIAALVAFTTACTPCHDTGTQTPSAQGKVSVAQENRTEEILAHHDTNAVFAGTQNVVCNGMTALCPNECGSSGTLAIFKIENYNNYEKRGKYGDEKAETFAFMLRSTTGTSDVSPELAELVRLLKQGEKVHLVWDHVYVSDPEKGNFPEHPIRKLEPLEN